MKSPNNEPSRPDYSRSHFQEPTQAQASQKPTQSGDIFGDILGQQGYSFGKTTHGPRSINEMRKVELVQTMDPEKFKVAEWVNIYEFSFFNGHALNVFFFFHFRSKEKEETYVLYCVLSIRYYGTMQSGRNVKCHHSCLQMM